MTLRLRLILVLVGIVAAGLLTADIVTYNSLGSFLSTRVQQQLQAATNPVGDALVRCAQIVQGVGGGPGFGPGSISCSQYLSIPPDQSVSIPAGTWGELRDSSGAILGGHGEFFLERTGNAPPIPANLPGSGNNDSQTPQYFEVRSTGAHSVHYEVAAIPQNGGGTLVVAVPLTETDATLGDLLWIEGLVSVAVLALLAALSWYVVRRGLRPLDDMTETAGAIAAGDLTQRVPDEGDRSEVGRLGVALNTMLGNIERAFDAKTASEERLRRFLADASHELRTPLTSIRGYAEMFDRGARDRPEDLATSMRHIRSEADRMSDLVNDLLLLARMDRERPFERERLDLAEITEDAVNAARVSSPDRAITVSAPGPVMMDGDAGRLRQVMDNLLSNAARHTPPGTPVDVRVAADGGVATVEVTDRGPGVPPQEQLVIFEPFHRSDPSRARSTGGVGLGLAIVAAITHAHGGDVGVRTNESGGATFWVRLPVPVAPPTGTTPNGSGDVGQQVEHSSPSAG